VLVVAPLTCNVFGGVSLFEVYVVWFDLPAPCMLAPRPVHVSGREERAARCALTKKGDVRPMRRASRRCSA
jgi:hypothetical protein